MRECRVFMQTFVEYSPMQKLMVLHTTDIIVRHSQWNTAISTIPQLQLSGQWDHEILGDTILCSAGSSI